LTKTIYSKLLFPLKTGKIGTVCQVHKPIWAVFCNQEDNFFNSFFIINTKNFDLLDRGFPTESFEIWQFFSKNGFMKTSLNFFLHKGEIWALKGAQNFKKKKTIIMLCGFFIRILELPETSPQINIIKNESMLINLANVFHWKLDMKDNQIITGDITGKITIFNFKKCFCWKQLIHNLFGSFPVGGLVFLPLKKGNSIRFLISGCYGGFLKIWDFFELDFPLQQIFFSKRWITGLKLYYPLLGDLILIVGFDNGFMTFLNFSCEEVSNQVFCHQGGIWGFLLESNSLLTIGGDGFLNFFEINSPIGHQKISLKEFFHSFLCIFNNSKPKNIYNSLQASDEIFSVKQMCFGFLTNHNFIFCAAGSFGTFLVFNFNKQKTRNF